jgi:hypothetical protein
MAIFCKLRDASGGSIFVKKKCGSSEGQPHLEKPQEAQVMQPSIMRRL